MTLSARIIEARTGKPDGMRFREITDLLQDHKRTVVTVMIGLCAKAGKITKVGPHGHSRYFADPAMAAAWVERTQMQIDQLRSQRLQAQRERHLKQALAEEARIAAVNAALAKKMAKERERKEALAAKKRPLQVESAAQVTQAASMPTKIIWPDTVKVQVHPTPPSRYAFEPPEGWRGQISMDQMERRLSAVQGPLNADPPIPHNPAQLAGNDDV